MGGGGVLDSCVICGMCRLIPKRRKEKGGGKVPGYIVRPNRQTHGRAAKRGDLPRLPQPPPFGSCATPPLVSSTQRGRACRTQQSSGNENVPPPHARSDTAIRPLLFCAKRHPVPWRGCRPSGPFERCRVARGSSVPGPWPPQVPRLHSPSPKTPR